jgi:hypothetical protein
MSLVAYPSTTLDHDPLAEAPPPAVVPNQLLVRFHPGISIPQRDQALRQVGPQLKRVRHLATPGPRRRASTVPAPLFDQVVLVETTDPVAAQRAATELAGQPGVWYVEPNYRLRLFDSPGERTPNDFEFGAQWALRNSGQQAGQPGNDIRAAEAWAVIREAPGVPVAVIDTGIDYYHPDLEPNVWVNPGEIPGNGLDDDGNGYIDDVHGYDFVSQDSDPMDDHSHGSHVAGIIGAAGDNRIGVAGVCWQVPLMAIKAFDDKGEASVASVVEALRYAADNGARIINASWGHTDRSRTLHDAVAEAWEAGLLIVAAAGNERSDVAPFPAAFEPAVTVAALNPKAGRAMFSNFGAFVDLAAPGEAVLSPTPNARYDLFSGTSMAAPHVSGVAALIWARHPEYTNIEVANILRNSVEELSTDRYIGTGRLHAGKAVRVEAPLPMARLRLPGKILSGWLDIEGTAAGPHFAAYQLEYGVGTYPTNWTQFHTSVQPVEDGPLFAGFSSALLGEGTYAFRLVVTDAFGQQAQDRAVASVRNVHLLSPASNDARRAGERLPITGTVFGPNRTYTLDHGPGLHPSSWTRLGVELVADGREQVFNGLLGWWDTSLAEPNSFHTLRLTARVADRVVGESHARLVHLDGQLRPGWPVHLPATGLYPTNDWRHFTVADLDGDGTQEILRVHPGSPPGTPAQLLVFGPDGEVRWSRELAPGEPASDIPVVGDVDGDGRLEIFTDAGEARLLYAFRHDGQPLGGAWPVPLPAAVPGKILADLNRDGRLELIGLANSADQAARLFVLDADGTLLASWHVDTCWASAGWPRRFPAVGNFDDDRDLEIIAPLGCSQLALFDLQNTNGPVWVRDVSGLILASPVVGDLDGDGRDEAVVGTEDPFAVGGRGLAGGLYALDGYGTPLPGWPVLVESSFPTPLALADVDGDGDLEIAVIEPQRSRVHLLHHDGFNAPGWPVTLPLLPVLRTAPVLADVDGDGSLDVAVAIPGLLLNVVYTGDYQTVGHVRAWRRDGSPLRLHPHPSVPGLVLEAGGGASRFKHAPLALTDLDGNGLLDLVASSIDDMAYAPEPPITTLKQRYTLFAWELAAPVLEAPPAGWPVFQRDHHLSGYLRSPLATNHPPTLFSLPNQTVRVGTDFLALDLRRYVEDLDHGPGLMQWEVTGHTELIVGLSPLGLLTVQSPPAAWTGRETLQLRATDPEGASATTSVTYSVRRDYTPPIARPDSVVTPEDNPIEIPVLANDEHPRGLPLRVENLSRPLHGRVQLLAHHAVLYTPEPDYHGEDSFTYLVTDGQDGLALATVTLRVLPVPDDPVANPDHASIDEDTPVELDVLANDWDADGEPLTLLSFGTATNGLVSLAADQRLRYVPETNWFGLDGFAYLLADSSGARATGTVLIAVKPVNDAPIVLDQSFTLNRNRSQDVFYQATDPDGDKLTFAIVTGPEHAELWTYPDIATYYPHPGFAGTDGFTYTATDGSLTSRVATVSFQILDVNNPPRTEPLELATRVNRPLTLTLSATDADDDPLTYLIAAPPTHGTISPAGTNFVYTPPPDFLGTDSFTFQASDGQDLSPPTPVHITVTDRNTPPVAQDSKVEVRLNTPTEIVLLATDGEGDPLHYTVLTQPVAGTLSGAPPSLLYSPVPDYVGPDRFTFLASDDMFDSAPGTITLAVLPRNRQPLSSNQTVRLPAGEPSLLLFDLHDPDDDPLRIAILKGPRQGLLYGLGTNFIYAPRPGAQGYDSFTYKAWDGHIYSDVRTVSLLLESPPPPAPPRLEHLEFLAASRALRLTLTSEPGRTLHVQRSTDLRTWETFATLQPPASPAEVIDPAPPTAPAVFYRALYP